MQKGYASDSIHWQIEEVSEQGYMCYSPAGRSVLGKTVPEVFRPRAQFFPIRTDLGR